MAKVLKHKRYIKGYPEDVKSDMYNLSKENYPLDTLLSGYGYSYLKDFIHSDECSSLQDNQILLDIADLASGKATVFLEDFYPTVDDIMNDVVNNAMHNSDSDNDSDNDSDSSNTKKSVRVLDWTDKECKELEFNIKENYHDVFNVFGCIYNQDNRYPNLVKKLNMAANNDEETLQLALDIVDYFKGTARFPKITKYYIRLLKGSKGYLNQDLRDTPDEKISFDTKTSTRYLKTQFTYEEVMALDPRYKEFMEQVPEDEVVE